MGDADWSILPDVAASEESVRAEDVALLQSELGFNRVTSVTKF